MYDLAIIGGGPAGVSAGVYAARKRLKTLFIAETIGGQSTDSVGIENWIGTEKISGLDLAKTLGIHLKAYAGDVVDLKIGERATEVTKVANAFTVTTSKGAYEARAVLVATGGVRRKLGVPGALEFENKGLTYCASCDGPLFSGQDVVVVGGGNAGFESAAQLLAYCKSVTLVHRNSDFAKADAATVEAVLAHPNMHTLTNTEPVEVKGSAHGFVSSIVVKNNKTNETSEVACGGIFVETGMIPATDFVKDLFPLDQFGRVVVNAKNQRVLSGNAEVPGVWAAGDCTDELYHQNNIAAGDGVKALEDIYVYLKTQKSE
ncbi:MAG: FAD-dependent oxidoreductase [bacterium]